IDDGAVYGAEPVRSVLRYDNEVAFGHWPGRAPYDRITAHILGVRIDSVRQLTARNQYSATADHVKEFALMYVDGGSADRRAVFEIGGIRGKMQQRLDHEGLPGLVIAFRLGNQGCDISGRSEDLHDRWPSARCPGWLCDGARGPDEGGCCKSKDALCNSHGISSHADGSPTLYVALPA